MFNSANGRPTGFDHRLLSVVAISLAIAVFLITWFSISESRSDSFELLREQGVAFTEALAQASENAIAAEAFYDNLVQARYSDLVASLVNWNIGSLSEQELVSFALTHDLAGLYLYGVDSTLVAGVVARGPYEPLPDFVAEEVAILLADPESNYVLLLEGGATQGETVHYYLELTSRLDQVVVLAIDAQYYVRAIRETGIGYLAQNMAREQGVEYIIYQATDGIIFASRKPGELLAIESDPFLNAALESDSIVGRELDFQGENVLELVRPFSTDMYPYGLFRVGMSLKGYYSVSRGFDQQIIIVSGTLFVLLLVVLLYLNGRRKRQVLSRQYSDIKSLTDRIFTQMDTGVAAIDDDGTIRLANRAFESAFAVKNVTGQQWSRAMTDHADLLTEFVDKTARADEEEISFTVDKERRTVLVARSKLVDESGLQGAVVMVVYDITRLKEYERASARRERLSEMGNLAAGVAHEIRNPLNTIAIAAQRLAGEFVPSDNNEQYQQITGQIRSETSRLNEIITRFLALAREGNKQRVAVDVDKLLAEIGQLLRIEGDRQGMEIAVNCEPGLTVNADSDGFKQVFLNLFNNSKEALDGQAGTFTIEASRTDSEVKILVTDSGPGIPPEAHEKVFAPYHTTKTGGTGLGLPTVQRIVSGFDGDIELDSKFDGGTRFVITLPAG